MNERNESGLFIDDTGAVVKAVMEHDATFLYRVDKDGVLYAKGTEDCPTLDNSKKPKLLWDQAEARPVTLTPGRMMIAESSKIPIRYQGQSAACAAFALVAGIELCAMSRREQCWTPSEWYADWLIHASTSGGMRGTSVCLLEGVHALSKAGICDRSVWDSDDLSQEPPPDAVLKARYRIADHIWLERRAPQWICRKSDNSKQEPMLDGPWITNTAYLECLLAHNHPIVVAMPQARLGLIGEVTASQPEQAPGKKFYCLPDMQAESHAMVIVGYERCSTKPYFILRDSGQTSPDRHVKYSYDYIRRYARYGVVILNVSDEMNCEPM